MYGTSLNVCDRFNGTLHHKKWPDKFGGNGKKGELGKQHGFAVAVAAENIFNLYHYSNNIDRLSASFQDFFLKLVDDIATNTTTLPSNG